MDTTIKKFKQDLVTYFVHKPNEKIVISYWETEPHIEDNDEVIHIGITKFDLSKEDLEKMPSEIHGVKCVYKYGAEIKFLGTQNIGVSQALNPSLRGADEVWNSRTIKYDPLIGGVSIGAIDIPAGTLANVVWDRLTGEPYLLTNEHVVSDTQNINPNHPPEGHPIVQPGVFDGGTIDDLAGTLYKVGGMKEAGLNGESADIDAAIIIPERSFIEERFWGIGNIDLHPHVEVEVGDTVIKSGRTTGVTTAEVVAVGVSANIGGVAWSDPMPMTDLIHTKPGSDFVQGGDSGSRAWKEDTMEPIGMVFAGSSTDSFIIRAQNICDKFNVTYEGGGDPGIEIEIDNKTLITDGNGEASITLTPEEYLYNISHNKYTSIEDSIRIKDTPENISTMLLRDRYNISFTISDYDTTLPVENTTINIVGVGTETTNSNGEASFNLPWRESEYTWVISKDHYISQTGTFTVDNTNVNIPISFARFGTFSLVSPTVLHQGQADITFIFTLEGATFNSGVESLGNWNIDYGDTALVVDYIELISAQEVHVHTIGIVNAGSISFQVFHEAMDVSFDTLTMILNTTVGSTLFTVKHGDTLLHNADVTLFNYGTQITDAYGETLFDPIHSGNHNWQVSRSGFIPKTGAYTLSYDHLVYEYFYNISRIKLRLAGNWDSTWQEVTFKGSYTLIGVQMVVATAGNYTLVIYDANGIDLLGSYPQGYLEPTHSSAGHTPNVHTCYIPTLNVVNGDTYRIGYLMEPAGWIIVAEKPQPGIYVDPARSFSGDIWSAAGYVWRNGSSVFDGSTDSKFVIEMGFVTDRLHRNINVELEV